MSNSRDKLLQASASLFAAQGITNTTTKQIGELAAVNEVTLFRQFGNKHGLLLALMEKVPGDGDLSVFDRFSHSLASKVNFSQHRSEFLPSYMQACLEASIEMPALLLSAIGEAEQYPLANRQAITQGLQQIDRQLAGYLERWPSPGLLPDRLAHLLHRLVFGYALLELISTSQTGEGLPERSRSVPEGKSRFIQDVIDLLTPAVPEIIEPVAVVADLPSTLVHQILQQAQKQSSQTFAWIYLLFGAGLSPAEIVRLRRGQYLSDREQQFVQIAGNQPRQVPINQWILGKRYGTYQKNPLTQWLRSRKDDYPELFLDVATGRSLSTEDLQEQWQQLLARLEQPTSVTLLQAQQTWCVEMLVRGLAAEDLALLLGWDIDWLAPYTQRAREKIALEQAIKLDVNGRKS